MWNSWLIPEMIQFTNVNVNIVLYFVTLTYDLHYNENNCFLILLCRTEDEHEWAVTLWAVTQQYFQSTNTNCLLKY